MKLRYLFVLSTCLCGLYISPSAYMACAAEVSVDTEFCDKIVEELKTILTGNETVPEKVKKIRAIAEKSFDINKISKKAISQITKKCKLSSTEEADLKKAILNYLYCKYVNLTKDYANSKAVRIVKNSSSKSGNIQKINYTIIAGGRGKKLSVAVFASNNKITDVVFNNVSLIDPIAFARKMESSFNGDIKAFIHWLNNSKK